MSHSQAQIQQYFQACSGILEALPGARGLAAKTSAQHETLAAGTIALPLLIPKSDPGRQGTLCSLPPTRDSLRMPLSRKQRVN